MFYDACFHKCEQNAGTPFLSTPEGLCFRNCITKFGVFYPTLKQNMNDAPHTYWREKTHNFRMKND